MKKNEGWIKMIFGRDFIIRRLEEIADGKIIEIDYVGQYLQDGSVKRCEILPYIRKCFEKIIADSVPVEYRKFSYLYLHYRSLIHPKNYSYYNVEEAIEGIKSIDKGDPIHFRGHVI